MALYLCFECGEHFTTPIVARERSEWFGFPADEEMELSPCCKSLFFPAIFCSICEEPISGSFIHTEDGRDICPDCYTECNASEL